MNRRIAQLIGSIALGALAVGSSACVIRESPGVNRGYGYGYAQAGTQGGIMVGTPPPYYVNSMPPEPLYETMTSSPGYGYVWIDGYWNWNGYEWVWANGHWVTEQTGYVYVQPYYDWDDTGRNVYYPGHWSRPEHVDSRVRVVDHRDGRPTTGYYPTPSRDRPHVVDHRGSGGGNGGGGTTTVPPPRDHDHRDDGGGTTTVPPPRDHDHRNDGGSGGGTTTVPPPRDHDHRNQGNDTPPPPPKHDDNDHRTHRAPDTSDHTPPPPPKHDDHRTTPPPKKAPPKAVPHPSPDRSAPPPSPKRRTPSSHDHRSSITKTAPGTRIATASGMQYDMAAGTTLKLK